MDTLETCRHETFKHCLSGYTRRGKWREMLQLRNTLVSGESPLTQHQQHQAAGGGFQGKGQRTHPVTIDGTPVGSGSTALSSLVFTSLKILHGLLTQKKARQHLFYLRKFGMSPNILRSFYICTVANILTGCITTWYRNCTAGNRKALPATL